MINIECFLEKNALMKGEQNSLFLVKLTGIKKKNIKKTDKKLNLSIAIDVSGSMDETVKKMHVMRDKPMRVPNQENPWDNKKYPWPQNPIFPPSDPRGPWLNKDDLYHKFQNIEKEYKDIMIQFPVEIKLSKLDQAKQAAEKAIREMKSGDQLSIIIFGSKASILQPTTIITENNKIEIINKIKTIKTNGMTDLHGGWVLGATEVAKKMTSDAINRVLVLTDGRTNVGVTNPSHIEKDVMGLYEKSISTSTFGIGEDFNEDLLQKMATVGGGNFYYIDDDTKLSQMFEDEFKGLNNLCASELKLFFDFNEKVEISESMNNFEQKENVFLLPNLINDKSITALFKLKLKTNSNKEFKLGKVNVSFKDSNGVEQVVTSQLVYDVIDNKKWNEMPFDEEVKVQETLLVIAKNKLDALKEIDKGNIYGAKDLLSQSLLCASMSNIKDSRLSDELNSLNTSLTSADSLSPQSLRKNLSYESYKTRHGK